MPEAFPISNGMSEELIQTIFRERQWSWSVIGLLSVLLTLTLRALFLGGILRSMKIRNPSWYRRTLNHYQKRSVLGWIFFGLLNLNVLLLWTMEPELLKYFSAREWSLILATLFFLSLFFHLKAYARSIVESLEEHVSMDKEL